MLRIDCLKFFDKGKLLPKVDGAAFLQGHYAVSVQGSSLWEKSRVEPEDGNDQTKSQGNGHDDGEQHGD